jgi:arsenite-transporting ATPase
MNNLARLAIFCGKGGVGKTTLSLAAGLHQAKQGRKVLVVSSHPLTELVLAVSLDGLSSQFPEAAKNFFVLHIDPKNLVADVVRKYFPVPLMAQRVLSSSIFNNLIDVAPGLKEFFFLVRMQELAERRKSDIGTNDLPEYDYLIWDAPASGHFLSTLRSAKNFEVFLTGPLSAAGAQIHRFFSASRNIQLFPVTPLEEMAIAETKEIAEAMSKDFGVAASAVLVNFASPLCSASEAEIADLDSMRESSRAMQFAIERGMVERERLAELKASLSVPQLLIPRVNHWSSDLDLLTKIGGGMDLSQFA